MIGSSPPANRLSPPPVLVAALSPRRVGALDLDRFGRRLAQGAQAGLSGVLVGGSTGRGDLLEADELALMLECSARAAPRMERIAGFGAREVPMAEILGRIERLEGRADAVLVAAPDDDDRVVAYFSALARSSPLPVLVYQPPGRRARPFPEALARELAAIEDLAGVKDSSGAEELIAAWRSGPANFRLLLGSLRLFARRAADVDGAILAYANLRPDLALALAAGDIGALAAAEGDLRLIEAEGLPALEELVVKAEA